MIGLNREFGTLPESTWKLVVDLLGTEKSLFYNMAGAKRNGASTFIELIRGGVNTIFEAIFNKAEASYLLKMKFEMQNVSF